MTDSSSSLLSSPFQLNLLNRAVSANSVSMSSSDACSDERTEQEDTSCHRRDSFHCWITITCLSDVGDEFEDEAVGEGGDEGRHPAQPAQPDRVVTGFKG